MLLTYLSFEVSSNLKYLHLLFLLLWITYVLDHICLDMDHKCLSIRSLKVIQTTIDKRQTQYHDVKVLLNSKTIRCHLIVALKEDGVDVLLGWE